MSNSSHPSKREIRQTYVDLRGTIHQLIGLDKDEIELLESFFTLADSNPTWVDYHNHWMKAVGEFYDARGVTRRESRQSLVFRIAQDLGGRIGMAEGWMRQSDYRDELETLIHTRFKTRRAFCEATGLSEDMLSHVLSRRKHLAIDTLSEALAKIGYAVHIAPLPGAPEPPPVMQ
jgi:hypothetical protein